MRWILFFYGRWDAFRAYKKEAIRTGQFFLKVFSDQVKNQGIKTPYGNRRRSEHLTTDEGRTVQWDRKKMFLRVARAGDEDAGGNRIYDRRHSECD